MYNMTQVDHNFNLGYRSTTETELHGTGSAQFPQDGRMNRTPFGAEPHFRVTTDWSSPAYKHNT